MNETWIAFLAGIGIVALVIAACLLIAWVCEKITMWLGERRRFHDRVDWCADEVLKLQRAVAKLDSKHKPKAKRPTKETSR